MNAQVERLLELAAQLPVEERNGFLANECCDPEIRAEVESLLPFYAGTSAYFEAAVQGVARTAQRSFELSPGDIAGAYRIVSLIGRGGMGAVYLARRADGAFEQDVAIKVVQSANASFLLERFERERRILALLDHPNIARILDGGRGPNGLPYLAMEYVNGEPIDDFCENRRLSLRDRLLLFLKVCDAVDHAHGRLIVHRDLKPANVLVTAAGEPKLLDFGIAKALDPGSSESGSTRVMTPEYASPEQVRGEPVTTAADVYSAGAVLFKVLTGKPPHRLDHLAPLEAARAISEHAAPAASSVSTGVPSDIDAILRKTLHTDAARRYRSAGELSADIRRFLDGRPVLAAPDTFLYRARRFLWRNAVVTSIAALAVISLLTGSILAINQARRAQRRFDQVRQLAHVFLFDFDKSLVDVAGALDARKLIASTAQRYLRQLLAESGGDTGLQREIAESYEHLGDIQHQLGEGGPADTESLQQAYEIRRKLGDGESPDANRRRDFIKLASTLAAGYLQTTKPAEAAVWGGEAKRLAQRWVDAEPNRLEALEAARAAYMSDGLRLELAGQAAASREHMEKAVAFAYREQAIGSADHHTDFDVARSEFTFANMLLNLKDVDDALRHALRANATAEQLYRLNPANQRWERTYQLTLSSVGISYTGAADKDPSKLPTAIEYLQRSYALASSMASKDPKSSLAKDDLIVQSHRYARALTNAKRYDEAAALYKGAGRVAQELTAVRPKDRRYWYLLGTNQQNYGALLLEQGRDSQAEELLASADAPIARALELDPHDAAMLEVRASQLMDRAKAAEALGDRARAQQRMRECLAVVSDMVSRDASAKDYIGEYKEMLNVARRLGVATDLR
jgi:serine/threonine protein kinase